MMKKFRTYLKKQKEDPCFSKKYNKVLAETRLEVIRTLIKEASKSNN
jgi:hypothetical protein